MSLRLTSNSKFAHRQTSCCVWQECSSLTIQLCFDASSKSKIPATSASCQSGTRHWCCLVTSHLRSGSCQTQIKLIWRSCQSRIGESNSTSCRPLSSPTWWWSSRRVFSLTRWCPCLPINQANYQHSSRGNGSISRRFRARWWCATAPSCL